MSTIFFISDMHFGHRNIINYCKRPYESVEEMDEALVKNWNDTVMEFDTVYHLGDWAFNNYHHIGRLNGKIISVPGNHDREREAKLLPYLPNGFTNEVHYLKVDSAYRFTLCHYPFESWRREYPIHLHGHTHGMVDSGGYGYSGNKQNRLDVGIDAIKVYRPISIDEVISKILETRG